MQETAQIDHDQADAMPSLNHSYICAQILRQLLNSEDVQALPELTLEVANGLTPGISVFPKEQVNPNFFVDVLRFQQLPMLAIDIISPSQSVQAVLEKARLLVESGIAAVWTVEPYGRSVFVSTKDGERLFHEEAVESQGIRVDFAAVFS